MLARVQLFVRPGAWGRSGWGRHRGEEGRGAVQLDPVVAAAEAGPKDETDGLADEGLGRAEESGMRSSRPPPGQRARGEEHRTPTVIDDVGLAGSSKICTGGGSGLATGAGRRGGVRVVRGDGPTIWMWTVTPLRV